VLVTDEHLSVGDQHFQHKCLRRIGTLRSQGGTLIFCSHNLYQVRELCERVLWLHDGRPAMLGRTEDVLLAYQDHVRARDAETAGRDRQEPAEAAKPARATENYLKEVTVGGAAADGRFETGATLTLRIVARLTDTARRDGVHVGVVIVRNDAVWCYGVATMMDGLAEGLFPCGGDLYEVSFVVDDLPLLSGEYTFKVALLDGRSPAVYDQWSGVAGFSVRHRGDEVGVVRMRHRWAPPDVSP
jgi:lipopolysaccharide transport system ATP-binding protein